MPDVSLVANDETNPLTEFADTISPDADTKPDMMGIGASDAPDDPASIRPLSQQAWEQSNPQQGLNDVPESGDVTESDSFTPALSDSSGAPAGAASPGVDDLGEVPSVKYGSAEGGNFVTDDAAVAEKIVRVARAMLGRPYVWGGEDWSGADCSGLVQLAYAQAGIAMPRLSNYQMMKGKRVDYKDLKPGDLVGWNNSNHVVGADHIAIYIGNDQIIEAPRPGMNIRVAGLYDYDVAQMWAVRIPGKHVPAQATPQAQLKATPKQLRNSGASNRAIEAASDNLAKKPKKKPKTQAEMHSTGRLAARN